MILDSDRQRFKGRFLILDDGTALKLCGTGEAGNRGLLRRAGVCSPCVVASWDGNQLALEGTEVQPGDIVYVCGDEAGAE